MLTAETQALLARMHELPVDAQRELLKILDQMGVVREQRTTKESFIAFVKKVWPGFVEGYHHKIMADAFERVVRGELKRLIINMAPRHTKSEFASHLFPAFYLGHHPNKYVIQASNTSDLAVDFGRKVRDTISDVDYHAIFPGTQIHADVAAAGKWKTTEKGEYFAVGVGGTLTGRGGDLIVIDDPHPLTLDTPIATTQGWTTIGDVRVGDFVFGLDGAPTQVVAKSPVYTARPLYEVHTNDGAIIECDGGHLWSYGKGTNLKLGYKNSTARELAGWTKASKPCMPPHGAVAYPEKDFLIHPWVLGAWLGDGTATNAKITAHPLDAPYMRSQCEAFGYATSDQKDEFTFGVLDLWTRLKSLKLLGNKHIPDEYLQGSVEQRMLLLQGLMDTDGEVSKTGQCVFHNKDEALVRQVVELLHSLGKRAQLRSYWCAGNLGSCWMHRVCFKLQDAALMPRKRERSYTPTDKQRRSFTVAKTDRVGDVQCITVARPDGLFLVGREYVVTHNSEQQAKQAETKPEIYDSVMEWYTSGPRQRVQPGAAIVIVMTRWSKRDLTGRVLKKAREDGTIDEWEVIELPAILPSGAPIWPEYWPEKEILAIKAELPIPKWMAQYQQTPTAEEGALIKREWWQRWPHRDPPEVDFIIQSWDTAFEKTQRSDYSACTTWGVFSREHPDTGKMMSNLILLDAFRQRMEFPELKKTAMEMYTEWQPEALIVEKRASGGPLIYELRAMGIPVSEFTPSRGNDKIARVNAVSDLFASGVVWAPEHRWADEVIEEFAEFPAGEHDDYVDSSTQALLRYRQGGFIQSTQDEEEDDLDVLPAKSYEYY